MRTWTKNFKGEGLVIDLRTRLPLLQTAPRAEEGDTVFSRVAELAAPAALLREPHLSLAYDPRRGEFVARIVA